MKCYKPAISQKLIWIDQAIHAGSAKYNIGGYAFLDGRMEYDVFNKMLNEIIGSQEVYTTVFTEVDYEPICTVNEHRDDYTIKMVDCTAEEDPAAYAIGLMEHDFGIAFNVENNYLYNFILFKISDTRHFWYAKIHHLVSDGLSFKLLLNQAAEIYSALVQSGQCEVSRYYYSEYAADDDEYYKSQFMIDDRAFWLNEFRELPAELLSAGITGVTEEEVTASDTLYLTPELKMVLQAAADRHKVSVFNIVLGLLLIYFSRTRQQQTITFGVPVLNRTKKKYRLTAGVFMNLLGITFGVNEADTFDIVIKSIKEKMSKCLRHQKYQYGNLMKDLQMPADRLLYDIRISYEDFDFTSRFGDMQTGAIALSNRHEIDKLAIYLREYHNEGFDVRFVYNTAYFSKESMQSVMNSLRHMIITLPASDGLPVSEMPLLNEAEKARIISFGQGPEIARSEGTFLTLWALASNAWPDRVCISCNTGNWSYHQINESALRLSNALLVKSNKQKSKIALLLPRSEKMIIGMLGSMMAGFTYIPLDPEYPPERINYILGDSGCTFLLTSAEMKNSKNYPANVEILQIEKLLKMVTVTAGRADLADPHQPCYIIYTSGSTGNPKGVSISHYSLLDYVCTFREYFELRAEDVMVQQSSVSFDTSVEEIFPILGTGGRLFIPEDRKDIFSLSGIIETEAVTILSTNPLVVKYLDSCSLPASLRIMISGGDVLHAEYIGNLLRKNVKVYNTYGPTESTVCASYYPVLAATPVIPIGRPIANREMYILDNNHHLQPAGIEGEIYIGGSGLALEYVNNESLTAEKFIPHIIHAGKKLYKTGDVGVLMPDGNFLFKGRSDDQLNYRGYRIEAGEVEKMIVEKGDVENCVVCIKIINAVPVLVAYVQTAGEEVEFVKSLQKELANWLPAYMIPEVIIPLKKFPLLVSGKINKPELPAVQSQHLRSNNGPIVLPRTYVEKKLYETWADILQTERFGINDSFFDLGGHSLSAMQLLNHYYRIFSVRLSIRELFDYTTISEQAYLITKKAPEKYVMIQPVTPAADYAVSDGQRRLWILSQLEASSSSYNLFGQLHLEGDYNAIHFNKAIQQVLARHEILRTVFRENEDGELRQVVIPASEYGYTLPYVDFEGKNEFFKAFIRFDSIRAFDLQNGPLLRAAFLKMDKQRYIFYYNMHHIISDGWSMELLSRELMHEYDRCSNDELPALRPLRIQYKDYAAWQQDNAQEELFREHRLYWINQLVGELPVLSFPFAKPRPPVMSYKGAELSALIGTDVVEKLRTLCRLHQATLFMGLMAVVKGLFYRYTGQEDIVIGTPVAAREHADLEDQIGFYVNTLALRTKINGSDSFLQLLNNVREVTLSGYSHRVYPFDRLVDDLDLLKDLSRSAVFDVMVILHNQHDVASSWSKTAVPSGDVILETGSYPVKFDLNIEFTESDNGLYMALQYNTDVYDTDSIKSLVDHYRRLMKSVTDHPGTAIGDIEFISAEEQRLLVEEFNNTGAPYAENKTLIDLCNEQADKTPDHIAVLFESRALTYRQLHEKADRLGKYLQDRHLVEPDDLVAINLNRSESMIIAIFGVLKSGCAYVPVDPAYPSDRIDFMISDSRCKLVIDEMLMEEFRLSEHLYYEVKVISRAKPVNLAYVIYTSGSTGQPKGVMIENRNVVSFITWCRNEFKDSDVDVVFGTTSICFDLAVFEIFYTLCTGKKLRLLQNALSIAEYLGSGEKILLNTIPGVVGSLLQDYPGTGNIKVLNMAGEPIPTNYTRQLDCKNTEVRNLYGPTETTTYSTIYRIREEGKILIGKPISNTDIYILSDRMQLQPVGIDGEIYIGGAGLARGYLNNSALTEEKFVANPFKPGERVYKTGDLGRILKDGNIELSGRTDEQVKVRGYRIETEEVEDALQRYPKIDAAVVSTITGSDGGKELAAYIISNVPLQTWEIRNWLHTVLPVYMIPTTFIQLEKFPLTPNGKIDKKKLPDAGGTVTKALAVYVAPRNETEQIIVSIWQRILNKEKTGIKDNFFESGGHSLKATRLANLIYKEFNVKVSLKDLFIKVTPEDQAHLIYQAKKTGFIEIPSAPVQPGYVLSSSQRRLWTLSQFDEGNVAYNVPGYYLLEGSLDITSLELAFTTLINHYEILRTIFKEDIDGEIRQFILSPDNMGFEIEHLDLRNEENKEERIHDLIQESFITAFDLSTGPLLRATVYRLTDRTWVFTFIMHHIITDGWSIKILVKELLHRYNAFVGRRPDLLPTLRLQYKDYALWQQEAVKSAMQPHKAYWLNQFREEVPVLQFPADKARPVVKTFNGGLVRKYFSPEICKGIRAIMQEQDATLHMGLLAAVNILLFRYTNQEDIIVGIPVSGREHPDLESQLGLYVNILALRTRFKGDDSYKELIKNIKSVILGAYEYQAYPFDELVNELNLAWDISRNALFDVMVVFQNTSDEEPEIIQSYALSVKEFPWTEQVISKFDLTFIFEESGGGIQADIEYNSDIFTRETIDRLGIHLQRLLQSIIQQPFAPLWQLDYLSKKETHQLLVEFNDTAIEYPVQKTINHLFEEQVARTPGQVALIYQEKTFTYRELNEKSNQLAWYLRNKFKIRPDDLVGIKLEYSEWVVIAILGVLKSGGAFVPVDLLYPADRIDYMLSDSQCKVLIDDHELNRFRNAENSCSVKNPANCNKPGDLAYVIYTSGSTGHPKGVMIEHEGVVNLSLSQASALRLSEGLGTLQFSSFSFDASCYEVFNTLLSGGFLVMASKETLLSNQLLAALIDKHSISLAVLPPSFLKGKDGITGKFRTIVSAGEALPVETARAILSQGVHLVNAYGPTEATVCATLSHHPLSENGRIIIGKPISNTTIYILDKNKCLLPAGVTGELYIGGAQLARGYLNRKELTEMHFIPHPFLPGGRLYYTGDLARWLPDGNIEYCGRTDEQVKIRGHRIETGEIENTLSGLPGIEAAVVAAITGREGENELVAYIVGSAELNVTGLRASLSNTLPAYMIPSYFVQLEELPMTPNGKINRKKLPDPALNSMQTGVEYIGPGNETEKKLVQMWQDILHRERIGIKDNFFELGGHSIKIAQLISRINKSFSIHISIQSIFREPTIESIAGQITFILAQNQQKQNKEKLVQIEL